MATRQPVGLAAARLRRLGGVTVRPFSDGRGAVVLGPGGMFVVETDSPGLGMGDGTADWLYRVDQALGRGPVRAQVVRTPEEVEALAEAVGTRPSAGGLAPATGAKPDPV